ncbi:MAG: hypothetical protein LUE98_12410 [Tannerellaceae bacterium]|nr:hypothetical protein [Tannerellaceae bacterium]
MKHYNEILNTNKANIELNAPDEIFVQVHNTFNYWVSNHGRVVNNLKGNDNFYMYKTGNVHLTLTNYYIDHNRIPCDTYIKNLVEEHFLFKIKGKDIIYHVDGDKSNNYYKNLVYIDGAELHELSIGVETVSTFANRQEYIDYYYKDHDKASTAYRMMYKRTHDKATQEYYPQYADATMYKAWEDNPELCIEYLESIYYDCNGEQMVVDKDLLCKGNKEYAPDKICWLPWTLNVTLSNSKKHYNAKTTWKCQSKLPYGVRFDTVRQKYYAEITMDKALRDNKEITKPLRLRYRDTPEEAFADYKKHKESYLVMLADKYMDWLPVNVYDTLIDYEVEPY